MSIANFSTPGITDPGGMELPPSTRPPLHRLAEVRRLQGVSRRAIARRLQVDIATVKAQEEETTDLPLSLLYQWQQLLDVPVADLLVDGGESLSPPILQRARLVRVMKTVLSILETSNQVQIRRMAQTLANQLIEFMPELKNVSPWHAVGQRRRLNELGVAAQRRLSSEMFIDLTD